MIKELIAFYSLKIVWIPLVIGILLVCASYVNHSIYQFNQKDEKCIKDERGEPK